MYSFGTTWPPEKDPDSAKNIDQARNMSDVPSTPPATGVVPSTPPGKGDVPSTPPGKTSPEKRSGEVKYRIKTTRGKDSPVAKNWGKTEAFIISVKGGLELIYFDAGGTEGYGTHYLRDLLFGDLPGNINKERKERVQEKADIVAFVPRRESFFCNFPQTKEPDEKGNRYKKRYFVRYAGTGIESTKEEKEKCLKCLVAYMNTAHMEFHKGKNKNRAVKTEFFVADEFVKSDSENLEPWDHYLLNNDVMCLMNMLIDPKPGKLFASEAPEMSANYFSAPYCDVAKREFGYGEDVFE